MKLQEDTNTLCQCKFQIIDQVKIKSLFIIYYISKAGQFICFQNARPFEHCMLLSLGYLGKTIIVSFL